LVIDDDESIRKVISAILEENDYSVDTAENGKEAIEKTERGVYDLALIDIRLPDMEGTELLTALKDTTPRMKKIILTGYPTLENAIEAVNKGADGFLLKPIDMEQLLKTIKEQIEKHKEEIKYSEKKVADWLKSRAKELNINIEKEKF